MPRTSWPLLNKSGERGAPCLICNLRRKRPHTPWTPAEALKLAHRWLRKFFLFAEGLYLVVTTCSILPECFPMLRTSLGFSSIIYKCQFQLDWFHWFCIIEPAFLISADKLHLLSRHYLPHMCVHACMTKHTFFTVYACTRMWGFCQVVSILLVTFAKGIILLFYIRLWS
jgi:hypothetical protein